LGHGAADFNFRIKLFDFKTVVPFAGTAVFLLAPSRKGPDKTKGEKTKNSSRRFWKEIRSFSATGG
jgi:hypothetical protein